MKITYVVSTANDPTTHACENKNEAIGIALGRCAADKSTAFELTTITVERWAVAFEPAE